MGKFFSDLWAWHKQNLHPHPEGEAGLKARGHRRMVGDAWDEIGPFQFEFMVERGLKPEDVLLDVACGSFRGGRLFIPYLNPGHYLGIDKQPELVREGKKHEVPFDVWERQRPEIVISDRFEFSKFSKRPSKALAQSLFTHLRSGDIKLCLQNLMEFAEPGCEFYASFFESDRPNFYLLGSHSSRRFDYTRGEMESFGVEFGWQPDYIGEWGHKRGQMMMRFAKPL